MSTARKDCIWFEQCGSECRGKCDDFTTIDGPEDDETYYRNVLYENALEYQTVIRDFSDRSDDF